MVQCPLSRGGRRSPLSLVESNLVEAPPKRLSPETLYALRRKRLMTRLEKKHPLFAD